MRSIPEKSLYLQTNDPEIDDDLHDQIKPNEASISSHISIVIVKMC